MTQCQFKSISGDRCKDDAGAGECCYWHDSGRIKQEVDLKERLQQRAQTGIPMRSFFLRNTDLSNIDLTNHGQRQGYELTHADLYHCNLRNAHLFDIDLSFSSLMKADLSSANLHKANLQHANLLGVKLKDAKLEGVQWGEMVQQEYLANNEPDQEARVQLYSEAEEIYRSIAREMRNQGMSSEIGRFLHRELITRRKQLPLFSLRRALSKFIDLYCGYGEMPLRLLNISVALIFIFALLHGLTGIIQGGELIQINAQQSLLQNFNHFVISLYFSTVTFTTLGYGDISPVGVSRFIAAVEAFAGSFTIALFVVVFVKRMTR